MGAYPALLVQPPQQQDVLGQLGKVAALKSMLMQQQYQQQMQPLQLQEAQNQIQEQQNALAIQQRQTASMDAFQKAAQENPKASIPELLDKTIDNGGHLIDVQPWFESLLKFKQGIAGLQGTESDNALKVAKAVGTGSEQLLTVEPQDRPQLFQSTIAPMWRDAGVPENQIQATKLDDQSLQGHRFLGMQAEQVADTKSKEAEFKQKYGAYPTDQLAIFQTSLNQISDQAGVPRTVLPPNTNPEQMKMLISVAEASAKNAEAQGNIAMARGLREQALALQGFVTQMGVEKLNKPPEEITNRAILAGTFNDPLNVIARVAKTRPDLFGRVAGRVTTGLSGFGTDNDAKDLAAAYDALQKNTANARTTPNMGNLGNLLNDVAQGIHASPQRTLDAIAAAQKQINEFTQMPERYRSGAITGVTTGNVPGAKPLPQAPAAGAGGGGGSQFSVTYGTKTYTFKSQKALDDFNAKAKAAGMTPSP